MSCFIYLRSRRNASIVWCSKVLIFCVRFHSRPPMKGVTHFAVLGIRDSCYTPYQLSTPNLYRAPMYIYTSMIPGVGVPTFHSQRNFNV